MTDFETHPVGTADLVKRLRSYQEFEQNRDGQIVCVESEIANEAADRIEQLVATVEQLEAALTRANAATAAAYEVAAQKAEYFRDVCGRNQDGDFYVGEEATMFGNSVATEITDAIRALATPDQTAALDKLIAEAVNPYLEAMRYYETQFCEGFCEDMPDRSVTNEGMENDCGGCKARAILAASKKGGV